MFDEVRTARLVGTRPLPRDADELDVPGRTTAQTRTLLIRDAAHWKKHRCGRWIWREEGVVVACGGLRVEGDEVVIDVLVVPGCEGRGLEAEIAAAAEAFLPQARERLTNSAS